MAAILEANLIAMDVRVYFKCPQPPSHSTQRGKESTHYMKQELCLFPAQRLFLWHEISGFALKQQQMLCLNYVKK